MHGGILGAEVAAAWRRVVVPSGIYRYALPAGWGVALAVSFFFDDAPCSPTDPCGPDRTFALPMIACFASLVLWWSLPRLAAVFGLLFGVLELRYDDVVGARVVWAVYAVACAVMLLCLTVSRAQQRSLTSGLSRTPVVVRAAPPLGFTRRLAAAGVLLAVGAAALGVLNWQEQREEVHLRRAAEQTAVAGQTDADGNLQLELTDGSRRVVGVLEDYPEGSRVPVLVDPADSGWLRLVAEPADYTHWYSVAGGAWILAILFVARDLRARKARPRRSWTASGLPVRIAPDSAGFAILPADGSTVVLGFVDLALDDKEADDRLSAAFDLLDDDDEAPVAVRREWARVLDRYRGGALYIGDLVEGEWPTLRIGDTILRSAKPFRAPRRTPWSTEELDEAPDATGNPFLGEAVAAPTIAPVQDIPPLPFSVPREPIPWWARPALAGVLIVGPVVAWLSVFVWDDRSFAVVVSVVGLSAMHRLADMVLSRVVVSADEVRIRTGTTEKVYSWRNVGSVELDGDRITLQLDDGWQEINGLARGRTAQAAAIFEALRLKARHNQQTSRRRRLNPWQVVEGVYLATCAVAVLNDLFG